MKSAKATFFLRLGSTVALWAFLLAGIFSGNEIIYFLILAGMPLAGLLEYFKMLDRSGARSFKATALISAAFFLSGSFYCFSQMGRAAGDEFEIGALVLFIMIVFARQMFAAIRDQEPLQTMAYTLFGLLYIPWMFNFITKIVFLAPRTDAGALTGQFYVLYLVMVTKFSDMGAYAFGSVFGRHPCVPHISPKKTWEGLGGAVIGSLVAGMLLLFLIPSKLPALDRVHATILSILLGLAAVVGDLAESIVKRSTASKDSSHVLPGIGGTLDLIDSLLFTAPILFFYMRLVLHMP